MLPLRLDLRLCELRQRAVARPEDEGLLYLATGFPVAPRDGVRVAVEVPPFAWAALERPSNPFRALRLERKEAPSEAVRSVPSSPHGSSCSARPGWAAFGGERRPASAQARPVLLGRNPFANAREANPFEKR